MIPPKKSREGPRRPAGGAPGWLIVLAAALVSALALVGLQRWLRKPVQEVAAGAVITVSTEPARWSALEGALPLTGTVQAWDELTLGSEASGLRIEEVLVEEGDRVRRGQLLARLNARMLEAQARQLRARLAQSRAALAKAVQPNRPQDLEALRAALAQARAVVEQEQANLLQARASLANAELNARRYTASLEEGFVTAQEAENRQTELERQQALQRAAAQRVESARFAADQASQRLELARLGGRAEDVTIAQAASQEIQAQLDLVEAQLAQTRIVAPDDGLILKREAHLGEIAAAGRALFTMVRQDRLELRGQVPEADLPGLRDGLRATVEAPVGPLAGRVWQVSPWIDPATRLGTVRIQLPPDPALKPGMFLRGQVQLGQRQALTVPSRAVLGEAGKYHVYRIEGQLARRIPVRVGARRGDRVELVEGVKAGEPVVIEGAGFLNDGDRVDLK